MDLAGQKQLGEKLGATLARSKKSVREVVVLATTRHNVFMTTQVEAVLNSNKRTEPEYQVICLDLPMEYDKDKFVRVRRYHKVLERVKGDTYATWTVLCERDEYDKQTGLDDTDELVVHPFIVWTLVARPEGWSFATGDYYKTQEEALKSYKERL